MKIWHSDNPIPMDGYSIAENLLFAIVAETPERELLPFEKLFVALNSNRPCHTGYLTDVYMACGCFDKAKEAYQATDHQRKLGDICWIQGDLDGAEHHYLNPKSGAQSYRTKPDFDRLIKLAFYREQWSLVIHRFLEASFSRGFSKGRVCCGNSETTAKPFLEMLSMALFMQNQEAPENVQSILSSAFGLSPKQWSAFRSEPVCAEDMTIKKIRKRCPPRPGRNPPVAVDEALNRGSTPRAKDVLAYINQCDVLLEEAQEHLEKYGKTGDEGDLEHFIEIVTRSGITSVSHSFLFSALGHDSFNPSDAPPERMACLYSVHPIMNKRYFGDLIKIKFEHRLPLTGSEIVTGLFQQMGSFTAILEPDSVQDFFGIGKLAYFRDWAELRLADWISGRGAEVTQSVADVWREGKATPVRHPFGGERKRPPETPRNMSEWGEMLNLAAKWLQTRWKREIGSTAWVSENQLYQLLKRQLKGLQVQQHAQPTWISPQHLDVFMPEVSIVVEYMGRQHYEPIDFFGGNVGFKEVQARDKRKQETCARHGIDLHFVKYDEDIGKRARELAAIVKRKKEMPNKSVDTYVSPAANGG